MKRVCAQVLVWFGLSVLPVGAAISLSKDGYHVFPGDQIQEALQLAARDKTNKIVKVHAGEYRPSSKRQALIWFNKTHDGIRLDAVGPVTLTAANRELGISSEPGFPAVVNHVVYFGDGISSNTVLRGFRITGANHFVTKKLSFSAFGIRLINPSRNGGGLAYFLPAIRALAFGNSSWLS